MTLIWFDLWSCWTSGTEETHWHIWHDVSRPSTKPWGRGGKTARGFRSGCNYGIKRQLPAEWEEVENSNNFLYCHTVSRNLFTQSLQGSSTSTQLASRLKTHHTARKSRDHFAYGLEIRCNQPEHPLILFHTTAIIHEVQAIFNSKRMFLRLLWQFQVVPFAWFMRTVEDCYI